jgi:hypothetical protein
MTEPKKSKLPPKVEDKVVEVSLKHVIIAFGTVLAEVFLSEQPSSLSGIIHATGGRKYF